MAQVLYEGRWPGAYLVSDDVHLSREVVTFAKSAVIAAGTVMGRITASGKYVPLNPTAKDGSERAAAIAYDNVDASDKDQRGVVTLRQSAVKALELIWPEGITGEQMAAAIADLASQTIILR